MMKCLVNATNWMLIVALVLIALNPFDVVNGFTISISSTTLSKERRGCVKAKQLPRNRQSSITFIPISSSSSRIFLSTDNVNSDEFFSDDKNNMEKSDSFEVTSTPKQQQAPPSSSSSSKMNNKKRLDPLLASLTKMDDETMNAQRLQIPIWGELILDRSLFIFLPVALFAIGGIVTSLYILANSGDEFVNAINNNAILQSIPTFKPPMSADSLSDAATQGCRGLCSQQDADLESLSKFMNSISGKK